MSQYDRIACLMIAQRVGRRLLPVFALLTIATGCTAGLAAADVPYVGQVIGAGEKAGELNPAQIWAIVAIAMFALFVLLGWGVFQIGTAVQTRLATLEEQVRSMQGQLGSISQQRQGQCGAGDALHSLLNTARTELEKTGRLIRGEQL